MYKNRNSYDGRINARREESRGLESEEKRERE